MKSTLLLVLTLVVLLHRGIVSADSYPYSVVDEMPKTQINNAEGYLHNVAAINLVVPAMVEGGKMQLVQAVVGNLGLMADTVDVEFGYIEWDSTFVVARTKTGIAIPSFEQKNVSFGFYTFPKNVEYNYFVRVILDMDEVPEDNIITQAINSFDTPRKVVLIEKATGTWCGFCPGAALSVQQLFKDYPGQVAAIDYHVGDNYEHELCRARTTYYEVPGYPTAKFNGMSEIVGGSSAFAWEDLYRDSYRKRFTAGLNHGTCLDMEFTYMEVDSMIKGEVEMTGLATSTVTDYRIFYVVIESHIKQSWGGLDSLQHVFRGVFPDWNGVPFITDQQIQPDVTFSSSIEFEFPTNVVKENCEIIAFVQNVKNKYVAVATVGEQVFPPVIPYTLMVPTKSAADTAGKEIVFAGHLKNLQDSELTVNFNRLVNDIPADWTSSICLKDQCLAPFIDEASITIAPMDSMEFSLHFFTANSKADSGMVTLQISDSTGLQADSLTFHASTIYVQEDTRVAENLTPSTFELNGNYPNPFNPNTTIQYSVASQCTGAELQVYSVLGQLVHNEQLEVSAGAHSFHFDASHLAAGVYMYRIVFESASGRILSNQKKLTLLK